MADTLNIVLSSGPTGDTTSMSINGMQVSGEHLYDGINLAVLNPLDGSIESLTAFQTGTDPAASAALAALVESVLIGRIVLIVVQRGGLALLDDRARLACQTLGSAAAFIVEGGYSWALIGQKGAAPGSQVEAYSPSAASSVTQPAFPLQAAGKSATALRALSNDGPGKRIELSVNGLVVTPGGAGAPGVNAVQVDELTGVVRSSRGFETSNPADVTAFVNWVQALATGRVVMIAVRIGIGAGFTQAAREACASLGSMAIATLGINDSWAMIGVKDSLPGSACEVTGGQGGACARSWMQAPVADANFFSFGAASGASPSNPASVLIDDVNVLADQAPASGLSLVVVSPSSGIAVQKARFDVFADPAQADALAAFIEAVPPGWLVAVVKNSGQGGSLNGRAAEALRSIGAALANHVVPGDASAGYLLLGCKGAASGSVPEVLTSGINTAICYRVYLSPLLCSPFQVVTARSAGYLIGNSAMISVNGQEVQPVGGYRRGLNVVLIGRDGQVGRSASFDTHGDPEASAAFVELINGCSPDQVVAIAVLDEASAALSDAARQACRQIGSSLIDQLMDRNSWCIVGAKGRAPGTAAEAWSAVAPVSCTTWVSRGSESGSQTWMGVRSAGYLVGDYAEFFWNGSPLNVPVQRGLNVVVFDGGSGQILNSQNFDTNGSSANSDAFAAFIENLPVGQFVAMAVEDDAAASLTERARRACRMLGGTGADRLAFRGSWAMVGFKGAAPGSAQEAVNNLGPAAIQVWGGFIPRQNRARWLILAAIVGLAVCVVVYVVLAVLQVANVGRPGATVPAVGRRRAVFVGIDYRNLGLLDLNGLGSQFITSYRTSLVNLGYFDVRDTLLLIETASPGDAPDNVPSRDNVLKAIDWLLSGAQRGDLLYFHFLGHGIKDTVVNPPQEGLITLNPTLTAKDCLMEADLHSRFNQLDPAINLTCVFHCCFSGGLMDTSPQGRGIAIASSAAGSVTILPKNRPNLTTVIGVKLKGVKSPNRPLPMPTYVEMVNFANGQGTASEAVVATNLQRYDRPN